MSKKKFFEDDEFEYTSLTKEHISGFLQTLNMFMQLDDSEIVAPKPIYVMLASTGLTIIARHKASSTIAGYSINSECIKEMLKISLHLQATEALSQEFLNGFYKDFTSAIFIHRLFVLPEFRMEGVGTKLVEATIQMARRIQCGEHMNVDIGMENYLKQFWSPKPEAVVSNFVSTGSKIIGEKLYFQKVKYSRNEKDVLHYFKL